MTLEALSNHHGVPKCPPAPESRLSFSGYAIKYWPQHAQLAGSQLWEADEPTMSSFGDLSLLGSWAKAYWTHSGRMLPENDDLPTATSILAENGLGDAVDKVLSLHRNCRSFTREFITSLEAAAKTGNKQVLWQLVKSGVPPGVSFDEAILAAVDSMDSETTHMLLEKVKREPDLFVDPTTALHRAVILGLHDVLDRIVTFIATKNSTLDTRKSFMVSACGGGNLAIVKFLLDRKADLHLGNIEEEEVSKWLSRACIYGHHEVANYLAKETVSLATGPIAITFGQSQTLKSMLDKFVHYDPTFLTHNDLVTHSIRFRRPHCCKVMMDYLCESPDYRESLKEQMKLLMDLAINLADLAIIEILIVFGAKLNPCAAILSVIDSSENIEAWINSFFRMDAQAWSSLAYYQSALDNALLLYAAPKGKLELTKLLVSKGANIGAEDSAKRTSLYMATMRTHTDVAEALVEAGANLKVRRNGEYSLSPVDVAAGYCSHRLLSYMLAKAGDVHALSAETHTPLDLAVQQNKVDSVGVLLNHTPDLKPPENRAYVLHAAVYNGNLRIVTMLLEAGADPCYKSIGLPYSLLCVWNNSIKILEKLVSYGMQLEQTSLKGNQALHCLSSKTDLPVIKYLVCRGASLEAVSTLAMVKLLVSHGADPANAVESIHGTPFQAACKRREGTAKKRILSYLLETGKITAEKSSSLLGPNIITASLHTESSVVEKMLDLKENSSDKVRRDIVNIQGNYGQRPVHFALRSSIKHVDVLHGAGADMLARDLIKQGPLHFAVAGGRLDLVQYVLKENGNLVHEEDSHGWTPLLCALRVGWRAHLGRRLYVVQELLQRGASKMVQGKGAKGRVWTALLIASYHGLDQKIIDLVTPTTEEVRASEDRQFWENHLAQKHRQARRIEDSHCNVCLTITYGFHYVCDDCKDINFVLCSKCYLSKEDVHPDHDFSPKLEDDEYVSEDEESDASQSENGEETDALNGGSEVVSQSDSKQNVQGTP
ncbi:ankyrin [Byssothecium circinans]|uniref:Ankyrin n=1 Tax=Byssothecium circinans TaxID=147558 RepID=A0A6A5TXZ1_9PLEO|nr:ankyrin [Byssothecium circinans]